MIRVFFGLGLGGPPGANEVPDVVAHDLAELRNLMNKPSKLTEAQRSILWAVSEKLMARGEKRDVDVRANSAVFRVFVAGATELSEKTPPEATGEPPP